MNRKFILYKDCRQRSKKSAKHALNGCGDSLVLNNSFLNSTLLIQYNHYQLIPTTKLIWEKITKPLHDFQLLLRVNNKIEMSSFLFPPQILFCLLDLAVADS